MLSFREYLDVKAAYDNGDALDEVSFKKAMAIGGTALLLGLGAGRAPAQEAPGRVSTPTSRTAQVKTPQPDAFAKVLSAEAKIDVDELSTSGDQKRAEDEAKDEIKKKLLAQGGKSSGTLSGVVYSYKPGSGNKVLVGTITPQSHDAAAQVSRDLGNKPPSNPSHGLSRSDVPQPEVKTSPDAADYF